MKTPVDLMMDKVDWQVCEQTDDESGLPFATHSGVLDIAGHSMKVYRLNTGQAIIDAADLEAFLCGMSNPDSAA